MSNAIPAEINPKGYGHILDMLEDAVATYGDKPAHVDPADLHLCPVRADGG